MRIALYEVDQAAAMLDTLLDRVEAGEVIGLTRNGKLVARLIPATPSAT
ncbi:type II toxin-antitoxin system prevent-host-death family antitoxin [Sphingomonas sp. dw_22]